MEVITRRVFLKKTIGGMGSVLLARSFISNMSLAQLPADKSRIVIAEHPEATDGVKAINADNVQNMMDESIKQLTGQPAVADAWKSVLPGFEDDHIIAIKVNAIAPLLPTHPEVVDAIATGLIAAGVPENNIIIYDNLKYKLTGAKYEYNTGATGVRCIATEEKGWGYDQDSPVEVLGHRQLLSTILTRCHHLINVPVLKVHLDQYGVTLALKNHYGSISNAQALHSNFHTACATLNSQEAIKDKTRLVVTDALFAFWGGGWDWVPEFAPNTLIVSRDPVAADYIGTQMLDAERAKRNQRPRNVPFIQKAAEMGLGTNDPGKMELLKVDFKASGEDPIEEEEEIEEETGKAVNPANSFKAQWGNIKRE